MICWSALLFCSLHHMGHTECSPSLQLQMLEMSEGHFATGSSPLPPSEPAHGQQRAEPGEAGTALLGSLSRQGQQHMVPESSPLVLAQRNPCDRVTGQGWARGSHLFSQGADGFSLTERLESFSNTTQQGCDSRTELPCPALCSQNCPPCPIPASSVALAGSCFVWCRTSLCEQDSQTWDCPQPVPAGPSCGHQVHPLLICCLDFFHPCFGFLSAVPWGGSHQIPGKAFSCCRSPLLGRASVLLRTSLRPSETWGSCLSQGIQESSAAQRVLSQQDFLGKGLSGMCQCPLSTFLVLGVVESWGGTVTAQVSEQPPLGALFPKFCPSLGPHSSPPDQTLWILQSEQKHFHDSC